MQMMDLSALEQFDTQADHLDLQNQGTESQICADQRCVSDQCWSQHYRRASP